MVDWIVRGGVVMIPIVAGSVLALAIFLERLWALSPRRVLPETLLGRVEELLAGQRTAEALELCKAQPTALGRVLAAALRHAGRPRARLKEAVEEVGKYEVSHLERLVEVLGTIAAIEPLLGLLGTITGMIAAFQKVQEHGLGDPSHFATGIWEALITTAAGLIIAIPAFIGYKLLLARVDRLALELEERALAVIDRVAAE